MNQSTIPAKVLAELQRQMNHELGAAPSYIERNLDEGLFKVADGNKS